jgi:hypothetical protein
MFYGWYLRESQREREREKEPESERERAISQLSSQFSFLGLFIYI